jgi:RNA polymerase sigma-70 factor, ECF subfamily
VSAQPGSSTRSGAGPTDAALVVAARGGEAWAQEALYQRYARLVIGLSHRILAGREEADDLAQDVFVHAFSRLDTLDNPQAFSAWISSIVVRTASKRLRRHRLMLRLGLRRNEPLETESLVSRSAPPEVATELHLVYSLLGTLPAQERVALVLRRVEGMELAEIAEEMGISLATVKRRLSAADGRLKRARERM